MPAPASRVLPSCSGSPRRLPTTLRQKVYAFLLVAPTIYILNLFRNVFVIMAYTGQWFPYYPDIAGNGEVGYESFFWAHNGIAELLALVILIIIAYLSLPSSPGRDICR